MANDITLNKIVAVEKGAKARTAKAITEQYHLVQKPTLFEGLTRTYTPVDDDGFKFPSEEKVMELNVDDVINAFNDALVDLFDVTATKDFGNTVATADIVVDGEVLVSGAPVPFLLFLEKELINVQTFIKALPTLSLNESWTYDENNQVWKTKPVKTTKTKKVNRSQVLVEPTEHHPAQVQVFTEDEIIGTWEAIKSSTALPQAQIKNLLTRVTALIEAVKFAREQANMTSVAKQDVGAKLLGYIFNS